MVDGETTNPIAIYVKERVIEVYAPSHHYTLDANSAEEDPALMLLCLTQLLPHHTHDLSEGQNLRGQGGWVYCRRLIVADATDDMSYAGKVFVKVSKDGSEWSCSRVQRALEMA